MAKGTGKGTGTTEKADTRAGDGVDNLTLEALAQMETDERMRGSRLQDLLRLLEEADADSQEGAVRELVRRGIGDPDVRRDVRTAFRGAEAPLRLRARHILLQIEQREEMERLSEAEAYRREQEALEQEARRRHEDANSCKEEASQYELEIQDWKKARNEPQEQGAHARVALARREAAEELRQARRALRDALDAYFDATDAATEVSSEARDQRRLHAEQRQKRRLQRQEDNNRDRLEPAAATVVMQSALSAVEAMMAVANPDAAASSL